MHRELEWPVSKETCLYTHLYMVYIHLYKIIEGTRCTQDDLIWFHLALLWVLLMYLRALFTYLLPPSLAQATTLRPTPWVLCICYI